MTPSRYTQSLAELKALFDAWMARWDLRPPERWAILTKIQYDYAVDATWCARRKKARSRDAVDSACRSVPTSGRGGRGPVGQGRGS